jgi:ribosome biogenesis GTPase
MPEGLITKALSGYYYVMPANDFKATIECRGRGILKKRGIAPLVGDRVIYELTGNGEGAVNEIVLPRKSELIRPPIANVDMAVLVFSLIQPELNLSLLDKFLVHTGHAGLETMICFSKQDLNESESDVANREHLNLNAVIHLYENIGYQVIVTSAVTGKGTEELEASLAGKITVFSGQSGVGKSSLLNAMVPGLQLDTNEISSKLGRGKHTTRHVELIPLPNGGVVADTPGFSQLDFSQIELEDLGYAFKEFAQYASKCKFRGCLHQHEPKCEVIAAKERADIAESRYKHYIGFLDEIREKKRRY